MQIFSRFTVAVSSIHDLHALLIAIEHLETMQGVSYRLQRRAREPTAENISHISFRKNVIFISVLLIY